MLEERETGWQRRGGDVRNALAECARLEFMTVDFEDAMHAALKAAPRSVAILQLVASRLCVRVWVRVCV